MQIQSIYTNNFKSLVDFNIDLSKFTCLVGLNGAGKSTVLQFIDFIGQQTRGDIDGWLKERHWKPGDLNSRLTKKRTIEFALSLTSSEGEEGVHWKATFNPSLKHCTYEFISTPRATLVVEGGRLRISDLTSDSPDHDTDDKVNFSYQGSVLSQLKDEALPTSLVGFKNYFSTINSLDLLSPEHLRQRTRDSDGTLGLGGQNLSSFLHEMRPPSRLDLITKLKQVYPQLEGVAAKSLRSGWKQLEIAEKYEGRESGFFPQMNTEARHVNDGMLRLIAILASLTSENRFLLFDEIENGMNPELVEFVLNQLVSARQQIVVTTHSPMILNYLDDDVARRGVIYLYKTPSGRTHAIPFFSIPSLAEKLTVMGPGEAFVDTNLIALAEEIKLITEAG
ncbi:AAA family ATPase [Gimesia maris]|uniref:AAA family ATPase n=1 Tax=Gimesia maris TaxID=122 RepID=UPI003A943416